MSLIQERIAIDRARAIGIALMGIGGVGTVLSLIRLFTEPFHWRKSDLQMTRNPRRLLSGYRQDGVWTTIRD